MPNGDEQLPLDQRKVLVGKIIHQLLLRGWRPPRQLPPAGMGELLDDIEKAGQLGQTLNLAPREVEIAALMA